MIMNERIGKLIYRPSVADLIRNFDLKFKHWSNEDGTSFSLLLFKDEILIELSEIKVDNCLEISVVNLSEEKQVEASTVLHIALAMHLVNMSVLKEMRTYHLAHPEGIFLSYNAEKTADLERHLLAIRLLYPLIKAKGLLALDIGAFDSRITERDLTSNISSDALFEYRAATGTTKDSFQ